MKVKSIRKGGPTIELQAIQYHDSRSPATYQPLHLKSTIRFLKVRCPLKNKKNYFTQNKGRIDIYSPRSLAMNLAIALLSVRVTTPEGVTTSKAGNLVEISAGASTTSTAVPEYSAAINILKALKLPGSVMSL